MGYFITLIAKYYYSDHKDSSALSNIVKNKILEFNIHDFQEYQYHSRITSVCNNLFEGKINASFNEREYIPIYENEIMKIDTLPDDKEKKLLFTIYAIARYMNCDGWINKKTSKDIHEVFKLANVAVSSGRRTGILHSLYTYECISFSKKVNNLNIRVNLENTGEISYKIKEFSNIGNQYIGNFKQGYRQCRKCGSVFRIRTKVGRPQQYCKKCADIIDKDKAKERMKLMYVTHKSTTEN